MGRPSGLERGFPLCLPLSDSERSRQPGEDSAASAPVSALSRVFGLALGVGPAEEALIVSICCDCLGRYNVSLKASLYAKYYFELRSLAQADGRHFPLEPLDKEGSKRLEERYSAALEWARKAVAINMR